MRSGVFWLVACNKSRQKLAGSIEVFHSIACRKTDERWVSGIFPSYDARMSFQQAGPIFIVGAPRSGTSMLHWALVQHENLWGSAESDFLRPLVKGIGSAYESGTNLGDYHWLIKENVSKAEFMLFIGQGIESLYCSRSGGLRWVDQTPQYVLDFSSLNAMFPHARFIHIVRDGRQVICSMQEKFGWSFVKAMNTWKQMVEAGHQISCEKRINFLQIKYESIVRDPESSFREIFEYIEEKFEPASVNFLKRPINSAPGREVEASMEKLKPRWKNWSFFKRTIFQAYCGKIMKDLGYQAVK